MLNKLSDNIKILILFVISYAILYFAQQAELIAKYIAPSFYLMPIVGFFFAYMVMEWIDKINQSTIGHTIYTPIIFIALSYLGFFVAAGIYYMNIYAINNLPISFMEYWLGPKGVEFNLFKVMANSFFFVFMLSAILGWVSKIIVNFTNKKDVDIFAIKPRTISMK